jgi:carbon storage regulator
MLILSRMIGEKIRISDNITIEVVDIDRGKIRLAISAPKEVKIYREELLRKEKTNAPLPQNPVPDVHAEGAVVRN